ncbi:MAG: glycosyltransferase [Flavobacteriales bacterium]|nr:glycosyltransferase [Flavobacteriales bacterium]
MRVHHISAECFPLAKVGGLADVVGALPKYQNSAGAKSSVIMPYYDLPQLKSLSLKTLHKGNVQLGKTSYHFKVRSPKRNVLGFKLLLIDIPDLLYKPYVYSEDDGEKFLAFQLAALDYLIEQNTLPNVIHCHDHHTGLIPFMMSHCHKYKRLKEVPSVFTIHNAQYQGWMSHKKDNLIPKYNKAHSGLLDWDNSINPLATAIKCAWRVTAVSKTYLDELKVKANGLESLIRAESKKCVGILNGIDTTSWDPESDGFLVKNFTRNSVQSGKKANKKWLCNEFGLDKKLPLVVFIGRLVGEKGADLFSGAIEATLVKTAVSLLFLGSGSKEVEKELTELKEKYNGVYNAVIGYDEALAHKMYAGGDFLLMPSRVEPCGLNQMYAMRYGTVPIVSTVGGLKDTVKDISKKGGNGICLKDISSKSIAKGIKRAVKFYSDKEKFRKTRRSIMNIDHSWDVSAKKYLELYKSLV